MAPAPSDAELRALRDPNDVLGLDDAALRRLLHLRQGVPAPPGAGHRELMRLALEEVSGRKIVVQSGGGGAAGQSADFRTVPVERWSPAAVAAWAAQVGLPPDPFTKHGVDGPQLLAMTETQMGALGLEPWMVGTLKSQRATVAR